MGLVDSFIDHPGNQICIPISWHEAWKQIGDGPVEVSCGIGLNELWINWVASPGPEWKVHQHLGGIGLEFLSALGACQPPDHGPKWWTLYLEDWEESLVIRPIGPVPLEEPLASFLRALDGDPRKVDLPTNHQ